MYRRTRRTVSWRWKQARDRRSSEDGALVPAGRSAKVIQSSLRSPHVSRTMGQIRGVGWGAGGGGSTSESDSRGWDGGAADGVGAVENGLAMRRRRRREEGDTGESETLLRASLCLPSRLLGLHVQCPAKRWLITFYIFIHVSFTYHSRSIHGINQVGG
jgi:hypothetical protein